MLKFNMAGITLEIITDDTHILKHFSRFKSFAANNEDNPDLRIYLNSCEHIPKQEGRTLLDEGIKWMRKPGHDKSISVCICRNETDEIMSMIDIEDSWNKATITYLLDDKKSEYTIAGPMIEILFRNVVLFHQGIVMHASAIECDGKGIMFSAPSGTGKSTQARLWKQYLGAKVLNDDRPTVRVLNGRPYVFGTPWSGMYPSFINRCIPLSAIVALEHASYVILFCWLSRKKVKSIGAYLIS